MKKIIALILSIIIAAGLLTACKSTGKDPVTDSSANAVTTAESKETSKETKETSGGDKTTDGDKETGGSQSAQSASKDLILTVYYDDSSDEYKKLAEPDKNFVTGALSANGADQVRFTVNKDDVKIRFVTAEYVPELDYFKAVSPFFEEKMNSDQVFEMSCGIYETIPMEMLIAEWNGQKAVWYCNASGKDNSGVMECKADSRKVSAYEGLIYNACLEYARWAANTDPGQKKIPQDYFWDILAELNTRYKDSAGIQSENGYYYLEDWVVNAYSILMYGPYYLSNGLECEPIVYYSADDYYPYKFAEMFYYGTTDDRFIKEEDSADGKTKIATFEMGVTVKEVEQIWTVEAELKWYGDPDGDYPFDWYINGITVVNVRNK